MSCFKRKQVASLCIDDVYYAIYKGVNLIGRDFNATVTLKDAKFSKYHTIICVTDEDKHFISDMKSLNGTKLRGAQLIPFELHELHDDEPICFADVIGIYKYTDKLSPEKSNKSIDNSSSIKSQKMMTASQKDLFTTETQLLTTDSAIEEPTNKSTKTSVNNVDDTITHPVININHDDLDTVPYDDIFANEAFRMSFLNNEVDQTVTENERSNGSEYEVEDSMNDSKDATCDNKRGDSLKKLNFTDDDIILGTQENRLNGKAVTEEMQEQKNLNAETVQATHESIVVDDSSGSDTDIDEAELARFLDKNQTPACKESDSDTEIEDNIPEKNKSPTNDKDTSDDELDLLATKITSSYLTESSNGNKDLLHAKKTLLSPKSVNDIEINTKTNKKNAHVHFDLSCDKSEENANIDDDGFEESTQLLKVINALEMEENQQSTESVTTAKNILNSKHESTDTQNIYEASTQLIDKNEYIEKKSTFDTQDEDFYLAATQKLLPEETCNSPKSILKVPKAAEYIEKKSAFNTQDEEFYLAATQKLLPEETCNSPKTILKVPKSAEYIEKKSAFNTQEEDFYLAPTQKLLPDSDSICDEPTQLLETVNDQLVKPSTNDNEDVFQQPTQKLSVSNVKNKDLDICDEPTQLDCLPTESLKTDCKTATEVQNTNEEALFSVQTQKSLMHDDNFDEPTQLLTTAVTSTPKKSKVEEEDAFLAPTQKLLPCQYKCDNKENSNLTNTEDVYAAATQKLLVEDLSISEDKSHPFKEKDTIPVVKSNEDVFVAPTQKLLDDNEHCKDVFDEPTQILSANNVLSSSAKKVPFKTVKDNNEKMPTNYSKTYSLRINYSLSESDTNIIDDSSENLSMNLHLSETTNTSLQEENLVEKTNKSSQAETQLEVEFSLETQKLYLEKETHRPNNPLAHVFGEENTQFTENLVDKQESNEKEEGEKPVINSVNIVSDQNKTEQSVKKSKKRNLEDDITNASGDSIKINPNNQNKKVFTNKTEAEHLKSDKKSKESENMEEFLEEHNVGTSRRVTKISEKVQQPTKASDLDNVTKKTCTSRRTTRNKENLQNKPSTSKTNSELCVEKNLIVVLTDSTKKIDNLKKPVEKPIRTKQGTKTSENVENKVASTSKTEPQHTSNENDTLSPVQRRRRTTINENVQNTVTSTIKTKLPHNSNENNELTAQKPRNDDLNTVKNKRILTRNSHITKNENVPQESSTSKLVKNIKVVSENKLDIKITETNDNIQNDPDFKNKIKPCYVFTEKIPKRKPNKNDNLEMVVENNKVRLSRKLDKMQPSISNQQSQEQESRTRSKRKLKPNQSFNDFVLDTQPKRTVSKNYLPSDDDSNDTPVEPYRKKKVLRLEDSQESNSDLSPRKNSTNLEQNKRKHKIVPVIDDCSSDESVNVTSSLITKRGKYESLTTSQNKTSDSVKHQVVFTMLNNPKFEEIVTRLGGTVVESAQSCTVLVTNKISRSLKFLTAIGKGKPIVNSNWLLESEKAKKFLDPWNYLLNDSEAEKKFKFSLKESLQLAKQKSLFLNYNILLALTKNMDVLKEIIETCGGKCLTRAPPKNSSTKVVVVGNEDEKAKYSRYCKQPVWKVVAAEAIFAGALTQKLNLDNHLLS